jgi:hypothetical protein
MLGARLFIATKKGWSLVESKRTKDAEGLPVPTPTFRRRAWRQFQRMLDPLAPPRPLPTRRRPQ